MEDIYVRDNPTIFVENKYLHLLNDKRATLSVVGRKLPHNAVN